MALMKCSECGGKVSSRAEACPHCGCPIEAIFDRHKHAGRFSLADASIENPILAGARIEHSLFGGGFVAKTTEDRIIIQCGDKQYQLQPKDFAKYAEFVKKENWSIFREKFKNELEPPKPVPMVNKRKGSSYVWGIDEDYYGEYYAELETDSGPDSFDDYYEDYHRYDDDYDYYD